MPDYHSDNNPWLWKGRPLTQAYISANGYVAMTYLITFLGVAEPLYYVGKKQLIFRRKGKRIVSDWETYWSSSDYVHELIKEHGKVCFTREVIALHKTFGASNYTERELLYQFQAIESDRFLNRSIDGKYSRINRKQSVFNLQHSLFVE